MKKVALLAAMALLICGSAMASNVQVTLCEIGFACTSTPGTGTVTVNSAYGTYLVNVVTGVNGTFVLDAASTNLFNLNNTNPLQIFVSGTGFGGAAGTVSVASSFSGNITGTGTVSDQTFIDAANAFCSGPTSCGGTALSSFGPFSTSSFSGSGTANGGSVTGAFSLTTWMTVNLAPGASLSSLDSTVTPTVTPIPEPASLALFGTGLSTLALVVRRRMRK